MTTAKEMVRLIEDALTRGVGIRSIVADGETVQYDSRESLINELDIWRKKVAAEEGKRSLFRGFDLGSAH